MNLKALKSIHTQAIQDTCRIFDSINFKDREVYGAWLAQSYYFVRQSSRILCRAAGLTPHRLNAFHMRTILQIDKEKGFDLLALWDLDKMGMNIESFKELPWTKAFYRSQHYYIHAECPESVTGYFLFLDGFAALRAKCILDVVKQYFPNAKSYVSAIADHDEADVDRTLELLANIPFSSYPAIAENIENSSLYYREILKNLRDCVTARKVTVKAMVNAAEFPTVISPRPLDP